MNFQDSFFESSSSSDGEDIDATASGKKPSPQEKGIYRAKTCESKVSTLSDTTGGLESHGQSQYLM